MAIAFRSVGTEGVGTGTISPGAPAGKSTGDLLLLVWGARTTSDVAGSITGWTLLVDTQSTTNDSLALFARIADGTSDDTPTISDFTSAGTARAQIAAFTGTSTDLGTIVAHSNVAGSSSNTADIPNPALTITTPNCLLVGIGKKSTSSSAGNTLTPPSGLDNHIATTTWPAGSSVAITWDYTIQTTATSLSASIWDHSVEESLPYASIAVALKPATNTAAILAHYYNSLRTI